MQVFENDGKKEYHKNVRKYNSGEDEAPRIISRKIL